MLGKEAPRSLSSQTPDPSTLGQNLVDAAPQWLESDYAPDEVSFNLDKQVRGGTLRALIVAATSHEGRGTSCSSAFWKRKLTRYTYS